MEEAINLFITWGTRVLSAILILIAGWVIGKWASKRIHDIRQLDETLAHFLAGLLKYAIFTVAIVTVLGQFGVQTASLIAVLGAAGLAIGLALQGTLSNVAAGTMLLILRPFKVGDYIQVAGNIGGTVKSLGLFGTELATADNVYIFMPNSQIWNGEIWNYARNLTRRQDINFGISYGDDIGKAIKVVQKVLESDDRVLNTPDDKKPVVVTDAMGASSIDMIARFWCTKGDYWDLRFELQKAIKEALDKAGITIPYPTIELVNPEKESARKKAA